ncbi:hypothetical protein ACQKWADRAFT_296512 [Trichoderma austrokoningii]
MRDSEQGITEKSRALCKRLLEEMQAPPTDSLFRSDLFDKTCLDLQTRNEARVLRDIGMLLVPSAEALRKLGDKTLGSLIESVDESWSNCYPLDPSRLTSAPPKPDYSLGFRREAFTEEQLQRLEPLIGDAFSQSYFVATYRMYFPFYTSEVKCGGEGLDVADRQNAHNMAIAVRAVVALFEAVGREKELDGEILAFSVSHDNESVRIYGWYPAIGAKTTTHRHTIRKFNFTELDGREKWTAYHFTKNVYRIYMPEFLGLIQSAIDELPPDLSSWARFDPAGSKHSGLSRQLKGQSVSEGGGLEQETPGSSQQPSKRMRLTQASSADVAESEHGAGRG